MGAEEWSTGLRCGGKRKEKSEQEDEGRVGVLICLQSRRKDVEVPARRRGACNGNGQMDGMDGMDGNGWDGMDGCHWDGMDGWGDDANVGVTGSEPDLFVFFPCPWARGVN